MRRAALVAVGLELALAGCISSNDIRPPKILAHERLQLELERDQALHQLDVLVKSEKIGGGTTHQEIYDQELRITDLEWRLGLLPYNTYHTRRRDKLMDVRAYMDRQREHGWCSQLDYDRVDLHVQRERMLLKEIEREAYEAQKRSVRERVASVATRGARNEAAAQAQLNRALVEFDAEMREW